MAVGIGTGPCPHGRVDEVCRECFMPVIAIHAPHLNRDMRLLFRALPHVQLVTGQKVERGEEGCLANHKAAARLVLRNDWPHALVVEDDCMLTAAFDAAVLHKMAAWAGANGYTTVFGGSVLTHNPRTVWSEGGYSLFAVDKCCSAHFVVHTRESCEVALTCEPPYDLQLGERGARCLVMHPFMAVQRPGMSGIGLPLDAGTSKRYRGPEHTDYLAMFAAHEQYLGGVA